MPEEGIATKPNVAEEQQPYSKADGKYLPKEGSSESLVEDERRESLPSESNKERKPQDQWVHANEIGPIEQKIIDAVEKGQSMPILEAAKSPAYKQAATEFSHLEQITDKHPNFIAIANETYEEVRDKMIGNKEQGAPFTPKKERKAFILLGFPASGKSSSLSHYCNADAGYAEMDSDNIKKCKRLREWYHDGLGAGCVQQPSSAALDMVTDDGISEGVNMAFPMVSSSKKGLEELIDKLSKNGYDIDIEINETSIGVCFPRMVKRYLEDGRFISPLYIAKCMKGCPKVYDWVKQEYATKGGTINGARIKSLKRTGK